MKTLAEKIAVMQAALEGKKIEVYDQVSKTWSSLVEPQWDWIFIDYRIAEVPIVAPEGFELVAGDSREMAQPGWKMLFSNGPWVNVVINFDTPCAYYHNKEQIRFAKPIVKREPRMPDAPVWWIQVGNSESLLIARIGDRTFSSVYGCAYSLNAVAGMNFKWSADRKTWFNFYGEQVP